METIEVIVRDSPKAYARLALLGDKSFVVSQDRTAFIMYAIERRSWVAFGDPVGPSNQWRDLLWQYVQLSALHGGYPAFYDVEAQHLPLYTELGMTFLKLGENAQVVLPSFSLEGSSRRALRQSHGQARRSGCTFSIVPAAQVRSVIHVLKNISDAWLAQKHTAEKRFVMGFFDPVYLSRNPVALVHVDGHIIAFANLLLGAQKKEFAVDLIRYLPASPQGTMDYLLAELLLWGRREGYQVFNLGLAPFSGLENTSWASFWSKVGALIFRHGEYFYNFRGLRRYKEKFQPRWSPRYVVCPGGLARSRVLAEMAILMSGGIRGMVAK